MSGDVRRQIAEALKGHEPIYRDGYLTGEPGHFVCECGRWISDPEHSDVDDPGADHRRHQADALLPVVDRIARERAAEELRKTADMLHRRADNATRRREDYAAVALYNAEDQARAQAASLTAEADQ